MTQIPDSAKRRIEEESSKRSELYDGDNLVVHEFRAGAEFGYHLAKSETTVPGSDEEAAKSTVKELLTEGGFYIDDNADQDGTVKDLQDLFLAGCAHKSSQLVPLLWEATGYAKAHIYDQMGESPSAEEFIARIEAAIDEGK